MAAARKSPGAVPPLAMKRIIGKKKDREGRPPPRRTGGQAALGFSIPRGLWRLLHADWPSSA